ncbi:MAG: TonB-dependent receptor [Thermoanaerobaculia bacterium]
MKIPLAGAIALALFLPAPALGQAGPDPQALEEQVRALEARQAETEKALEALKEALARSSRKEPGPVEPAGLVPKSFPLFGSSGPVSSGIAFNPSITVIPDFVYARDDVRGAAGEILEEADGFHGVHAEEGHDHAHGGLKQGFNLRETELAFTASVDAYFDVQALFAVSEEGIEAEEVFFQTRRLPFGFQLKGGKLLSGIGYANAHHPHQWDFADQNLAYELLLGGHGLNEKGLQLTWLPKVPFYLKLGVELLQGENERLANHLGDLELPGLAEGDAPRVLSGKSGPRLFTGFVKLGPDLGYSSALQVGASFASSRSHQEVHDEDADGIPDEVLDGTATLWGLDAVWKYDSPRPHGAGDLVLQAEYLRRKKDLDLVGTPDTAVFRQDGAYIQAVYGLLPRLQLGARWDGGGLTNETVLSAVKTAWGSSRRFTAALTFNPTEYSRVRAQYERASIRVDGEKESWGRFLLQLQLSLGAHGAHAF